MLYPSFENDKNYLFKKFQNPEFDPATGIEKQAVLEQVTAYADEWKDRLPVTIIKSRCFELACSKMQIDVNPHDCFPGFGCYDRSMRPYKHVLGKFCSEVVNKQISKEVINIWNERQDAGLHTVWPDFDHSVPEWENVFELGFPGLRDRARAYREKHAKNGTLTKEVEAYFDGIEITLNAILECIGRLIDYAKEHHSNNPRIQREIRCLEQMRNGAPRDTYEILMIIYLYFYFGEYIDHMQVRSMSNLDAVIYPYYKKDLAEGRYSAMDIREFITCFLMQWGSIDNYWGHPLYLGGTAADGSTLYNECSSLILEIFEELDIPTPKLQLKLAKNSPDSIIKQALRMVREHNSSLVFISDENAQDILIKDLNVNTVASVYPGVAEIGIAVQKQSLTVALSKDSKNIPLVFHQDKLVASVTVKVAEGVAEDGGGAVLAKHACGNELIENIIVPVAAELHQHFVSAARPLALVKL